MVVVLYKKQAIILDFLKQYITTYGAAPTLRQIADAVGVKAVSTIYEHLYNLEKEGFIKRSKRGKNIEFVKEKVSLSPKGTEVPVLGFITLGLPIEPYTDLDAKISIPPTFIRGNRRIFALKAKGNSMENEQIKDGDYIICEQTQNAKNGDFIIALLDNGTTTLKKFFKEETRIRLESTKSKIGPIFVKNVKIQGKVIGLIRKYDN